MTGSEITVAGAADLEMIRDWADEEGWNPGDSDRFAFAVADPGGFLVGRLGGRPVACVSAVRYGAGFGFIGFYIVRPSFRGQGHGIRLWRAAMERLDGRLIGLDGVVAQQDNYRKSGFRPAWNNVRYEGVVVPHGSGGRDPDGAGPGGIEVVDAATLSFGRLAAYDRRFFPESRDAFLSAWTALPGRTALAAVREGRIEGLGVIRPCSGPSRIGPLYAADDGVALALLRRLAQHAPGGLVSVDVPDVNERAVALFKGLGLVPVFEAARMYTGPAPELELAGIYGVTSLELG
ncbi:GCN5 family acetyltransferase [Streptomyces sp. CB00455]|uniref:GNAT family N-acetyltransferase n=1 Tax=Streptomyces sp. CB00455 TaxID=1703927 RepID=UPI00093AD58B|nr:GNAT family N-acetyltransferase [Streptomyces sp. CB00455]OKK17427.1 GCN5 family acetyltransferase [Streptomyces sp. CB00455]